MAKICKNLENVAQILEEFSNIFGPELIAVTSEPKRIKKVLGRVKALVRPLKEVLDSNCEADGHRLCLAGGHQPVN